ncbi:MAG: LamG domain-containing protein [Verrucomicrobiales bacterium]|nr:LamG domain-containing protein [Verrucomicrobiales bacterium]
MMISLDLTLGNTSAVDFRTDPPTSSGGVLATKTANAFASGPPLTEISPDEDFTIEGWVYVPNKSAGSTIPTYLFFQEGLADIEISGTVFGGQIVVFFGGATGNAKEFQGPIFVRLWTELANSWHHFAVVNDIEKQEKRIYWNGIITVPRQRQTTTFGNITPPLDKVSVGGALVNDSSESGHYWDEIRVSRTIRYPQNFTPPRSRFAPDSDTVVLWHFDEPEGAMPFADAADHGHDLQSQRGAQVVSLALSAPPRLAMERLPNGELRLTLFGLPGRRYQIQSSSALNNWSVFQEFSLETQSKSLAVSSTQNLMEFFRAQEMEP